MAGGVLDADTVWDADTVLVVDDVTVTAGATLEVLPGVTVRFDGYHGLLVRDGVLVAEGTPAAPITWTAADPSAYDAGPGDEGCWNGITLLNVPAVNDTSRLSWCVLEHAKALPGRGLDDDTPRVGGRAFDGAGGALRIVGGAPVRVTGCVFRHNSAERGGALAVHYGAAPIVADCLFVDNVGRERAGAAFAGYSHPRFVHDTFLRNACANTEIHDRTAAAVDHFHAAPLYVGCVIHGNTTNHIEGFQILESHEIDVIHCDIQDYGLGVGGLDLDPLLSFEGDISGASPCRDAGAFTFASAWLPPTDLAGRPRVIGGEIDMGCYEYGTASHAPPGVAASHPRVWPNPANPSVTVGWRMAEAGPSTVVVYDLAGRRVRLLSSGYRDEGEHKVVWDGADDSGRRAPTGVYRVRVHGTGGTAATSLSLVR